MLEATTKDNHSQGGFLYDEFVETIKTIYRGIREHVHIEHKMYSNEC